MLRRPLGRGWRAGRGGFHRCAGVSLMAFGVVGTFAKPAPAGSVAPAQAVHQPLVPAAGTAYLGAFVDPGGTGLSAANPTGGNGSLQAELSALPDFEAQEGRVPSMLSVFQDWSEPVDVGGDRCSRCGRRHSDGDLELWRRRRQCRRRIG